MSPLATACQQFATALAAVGVDPNRVTVVVEERDLPALRIAAELLAHMSPALGRSAREVNVEGITFLQWRQAAR